MSRHVSRVPPSGGKGARLTALEEAEDSGMPETRRLDETTSRTCPSPPAITHPPHPTPPNPDSHHHPTQSHPTPTATGPATGWNSVSTAQCSRCSLWGLGGGGVKIRMWGRHEDRTRLSGRCAVSFRVFNLMGKVTKITSGEGDR